MTTIMFNRLPVFSGLHTVRVILALLVSPFSRRRQTACIIDFWHLCCVVLLESQITLLSDNVFLGKAPTLGFWRSQRDAWLFNGACYWCMDHVNMTDVCAA